MIRKSQARGLERKMIIVFGICFRRGSAEESRVRGALLSVLILVTLACLGCRKTPPEQTEIAVLPLFQPLYIQHKNELGLALVAAEENKTAGQADMEQARVIWLENEHRIYVLPTDRSRKVVMISLDRGIESDSRYSDIKQRTALLEGSGIKIPPGLLPPLGGVLSHWLRSPKDWEWVGFEKWSCTYGTPSGVWNQPFERGMIAGPFRLDAVRKQEQMTVVLFKQEDGSWGSWRLKLMGVNAVEHPVERECEAAGH